MREFFLSPLHTLNPSFNRVVSLGFISGKRILKKSKVQKFNILDQNQRGVSKILHDKTDLLPVIGAGGKDFP